MSSVIVNPFKPTAGAEPPLLIGRDDVIAEFENGIRGGVGAPGRLMRISGPRGSGKTVLLSELGELARSHGWRTADVSAGEQLIDDLVWELSPNQSVEGYSVSASAAVAKGEIHIASKAPNLRALLSDAAQEGNGLLVTVDEVQDASHEDMRQIAASVQHLIREKRDIAFVFAGLPVGVMDLINGKALTFLRRAVSEELGAINRIEVGLALRESFQRTGLVIKGEALDLASEKTGGYPYLIQLVGFHVWERANRHREEGAEATLEDVEDGSAIAMERFHQAVHEPAINGLSRNALEYLFVMAKSNAASSTAEIARVMGRTTAQASSYRRGLIQRQVIEQTAPGYVDYSIPYLREYLRENKAEILMRYGEA